MPTSRAATVERDRRVLDSMKPGVSYEAREVAAALDITVSIVRHVLERLRRDSQITRIEPVWRELAVNWRRDG